MKRPRGIDLSRGRKVRASRCAGFTLIEVVVALFVVALGMGALLATLTSSADTLSHLRNRSFAQWIALNRISEIRLSATRPGVGTSDGELEYAGSTWRWRQQVSNPGIAGMLRIDVAVAPAAGADARAADGDREEDFPTLGSAYGFIGTSVAPPDGFDPDWSFGASTPGPGEQQDQDGSGEPSTDSGSNPQQEP